MTGNAFSLGEELELRKVEYKLHRELWSKFNYPDLNLNFNQWVTIKYLNDNADNFDANIENIPNDKGGLYMFYVKCEIITGITEYPLYVGRAQFTANQNLRKRVKEYFQKYQRNDERPKITRMFNYWKNDLHLAYFPLDDNEDTVCIEKEFINSLLLPMNTEIPDAEIKQAIKAFQ
ncbi:hypothetical protein SAMN05421780_11317 [Flexibacter flexilis DSM 6793]|uniref:GIY-YIG domain-containing protein n=1 Tax=Flexibacter flexilis DSM 6793 TaxID=927664 RepID=A0A1I1N6P3_9BACT|nr:hypothetical protein [Flexibacter flexilis]SFC93364.1 hypothetical protein SAMN05421780_11317 [Flexibacter flexilis DSM 6793]